MASDRLVTRDGKVLKEIGSWEREQLNKNPIKEFKPKPHKNCRDTNLAYMYRAEHCKSRAPNWTVKIKINEVYYGAKSFHDLKYGGEEEAKKAAMDYRDAKIEELRLQGIVPHNRKFREVIK